MTQDINVTLYDFKDAKGHEFVVPNEDGSYTIVINSRLSYSGQLKAYEHAMKHINENDFEKENVQQIEYNAHSDGTTTETIPIPAEKYLKNIKNFKQNENAFNVR